ncbi:hypothetical protein LX36DRAFT_279553 [Colletotrichum falcatum]|nr:hypothetical protein LX36DRAFT_279553 [Colletotrichum falcatum]
MPRLSTISRSEELFCNPTFVPFLMIWIMHGIGGWGISFVLPTVIYELGISNTAASQVMTVAHSSKHPKGCPRNNGQPLVASFRSRLGDYSVARVPRPRSTAEPTGCRFGPGSCAECLLRAAHYGQELDCQVPM